ncbi:YusG family protein [Bacillus alkalicellulosilyticus]|uniref:YusG family protein n=1 Tax=Alkalihalobacterium alkalicellulosilyticum TaxID=1912214 RepID=UPI001FE3BAA2|nr:YusG family protein [Bacillus alkalicellulosilyticus]
MNEPSMKKVDVTGKIEGKLENGAMNLYMDEAVVGKIIMSDEGKNTYEMSQGYEFEDNKVFRYEAEHPEDQDKYVEGCDMGWC